MDIPLIPPMYFNVVSSCAKVDFLQEKNTGGLWKLKSVCRSLEDKFLKPCQSGYICGTSLVFVCCECCV